MNFPDCCSTASTHAPTRDEIAQAVMPKLLDFHIDQALRNCSDLSCEQVAKDCYLFADTFLEKSKRGTKSKARKRK